jgi:uncharacterized protein (DUF1501 family)
MNSISRRTLLQLGMGTLGYFSTGGRLGQIGRIAAQTTSTAPDYKALVCVFLAGGNDANNLIVPLQTSLQTYSAYSAVRGSDFGVDSSQLLPIVTSTGDQYGLHPQLSPLVPLYNQGNLAVVANVGTLFQPSTAAQIIAGSVLIPFNLYSHSDQQSQWQSAQTRTPSASGWGGRVADLLQSSNPSTTFPLGISMAGNNLFLNGNTSISGQMGSQLLAVDGSDGSFRDAGQQKLLSLSSGLSLIQSANLTARQAIAFNTAVTAVLSGGTGFTTAFPKTILGNQLFQVAQLIQARAALGVNRQIFYVNMGGFDLHSFQKSNEAVNFPQLAQAMAAFFTAMIELGTIDNVVTFTESEFGRTLQPNTTGGTDHAWGSHHLVMGGPVKTANVYGTFPRLLLNGPDDSNGRGAWVPTTSLDQYGATLASWFGVPDTSMNTVFPNLPKFPIRNLGFV